MLLRVFDPGRRITNLGDEPAGPSLSEALCAGWMQKPGVKGALPLYLALSKSQQLLLLLEETVRLLWVLLHLSSTVSQAMGCTCPQHRSLITSRIFRYEIALVSLEHCSSSAAKIVTRGRPSWPRNMQDGAILIYETWHDYKCVMCQARSGQA